MTFEDDPGDAADGRGDAERCERCDAFVEEPQAEGEREEGRECLEEERESWPDAEECGVEELVADSQPDEAGSGEEEDLFEPNVRELALRGDQVSGGEQNNGEAESERVDSGRADASAGGGEGERGENPQDGGGQSGEPADDIARGSGVG